MSESKGLTAEVVVTAARSTSQKSDAAQGSACAIHRQFAEVLCLCPSILACQLDALPFVVPYYDRHNSRSEQRKTAAAWGPTSEKHRNQRLIETCKALTVAWLYFCGGRIRWMRSKSKSKSTCFCSGAIAGFLVRLKMRQRTRTRANSAMPSIPMNFLLPA